MCDPELDNNELNTINTMPMFNTKCVVLIKIKDYPIGKNLKCYVWMEGSVTGVDVQSRVKNFLTLSETYKDYDIKDIEVVSTIMTNTMEMSEKFGELTLMSITNVFEGNPKKQKNKKFDIKDIKYSELTDKEIEDLDRKVSTEAFKRRNKFTDAEFSFWVDNSKDIKIEEVKEIYAKCGGDIFKLRKAKIRENITNMLENKKEVN
jgi:hypothetical protein